jgi:hypothetical protein
MGTEPDNDRVAIERAAFGEESVTVAQRLYGLGAIQAAVRRYAEAEATFRRTLEMQRKTLGPDHPQVARTLSDLGCLLHPRPIPGSGTTVPAGACDPGEGRKDPRVRCRHLFERARRTVTESRAGRARRRDYGSARSGFGRPSWARSIPYWPRSRTWACCFPINAGWRKPRCCFCALSPSNKRPSEWTPMERA